MLLTVLKILAVVLIILCVMGGIRRLADNFRAWRFERKHRALFDSCRKEQEKEREKE